MRGEGWGWGWGQVIVGFVVLGSGAWVGMERDSLCGEVVLAREDGEVTACAVFFGLKGRGDRDEVGRGRGNMFGGFIADLVVAPEVACVELAFGLGVIGFLEDLGERAHDDTVFDGALSEGGTDKGFAECKPKFKGC